MLHSSRSCRFSGAVRIALLSLLAWLFTIPGVVLAQPYHVSWDTGDDATGDGSAERPWKHLGMALYAVPAGTEEFPTVIRAAEGVHPENLTITKPWLWIEGSYHPVDWTQQPGPPRTTIDGRNLAVVLDVGAGLEGIRLSGLVVANGLSDLGGGIQSDSALTMTNCVVRDCRATQRGGGVWMGAGAVLALVDSIIEENSITGSASDYRGGGIHGSCHLLRSVVRNNRIDLENAGPVGLGQVFGGGISGDCTLIESTVSGNSISSRLTYYNGSDDVSDGEQSLAYGGGIYGTCNLTDSTVRGNRAHAHGANRYFNDAIARGGGICGTSTLLRCVVGENVVDGNHGGSRWDYYQAGAYGGGLFGTTTITACDIRENVATATASTYIQRNAFGGGVYSTDCSLTSTTLAGNSATGTSAGSGGAVAGNGNLLGCRVEDNVADLSGGGLYRPASGGALRAESTVLLNNRSESGGGAHGDVTLERCVVRGNRAGAGNGAGLHGNAPGVTNSLFVGNVGIGASVATGVIRHSLFALTLPMEGQESEGLRLYGSGASLFNNVFVHNGHGVFEASPSADPAELKNNLFFGNTVCAYTDEATVCQSFFFQINGLAGAAGNLVGQDPMFMDAEAGDFHLAPGSPAIDAALESAAAPVDHDGNPRPFGEGSDIGPFEAGYALPPVAPVLVAPSDVQTEVPHLAHFQWQDAPRAAVYDLYLWRAELPRPPAPVAAGLSEPEWFNVVALDNFASYRWQVVASNDAGQAESDVWTFETLRAEALLRLGIEGNGQIRVNGALRGDGWEQWFPFGSVVSLEAVEAADSHFVRWSGDIAMANAEATAIELLIGNSDRAVAVQYRLTPPKVELSESSMEFVVWPEQTTTHTLRISNKGDRVRRDLTFEVTSGTNSVAGVSTFGTSSQQEYPGSRYAANLIRADRNTVLTKVEPYVQVWSYIQGTLGIVVYEAPAETGPFNKIYETTASTYGPTGSGFFPFAYFTLPAMNVPLISGRYYLIGVDNNSSFGSETGTPEPLHFGTFVGGHESAHAQPAGAAVAYSPVAKRFTFRLTTADYFAGKDWLSVSPSTGTVPYGQTVDLRVVVSGAELPGDKVGSELNVTTNDQDALTTKVLVARRAPEGTLMIDPPSLTLTAVRDTTATTVLHVGNTATGLGEPLRYRVTGATDSSGGVTTLGDHTQVAGIGTSFVGNTFRATRNTTLTKFEPYVGLPSYYREYMSMWVFESSEQYGTYRPIHFYSAYIYEREGSGFYPFGSQSVPATSIPIVAGRYYMVGVSCPAALIAAYFDPLPSVPPTTTFGEFLNGCTQNIPNGTTETTNCPSTRMLTMRLTTVDPDPLPNWLQVAPASGDLAADESHELVVTCDAAGLPIGEHTSVLNITSTDSSRETMAVPVTFTVITPTPSPTPEPTPTATPEPNPEYWRVR